MLERESLSALSIITRTIKRLNKVNSRIDNAINNIARQEAELSKAGQSLGATKEKNNTVLKRLNSLIEE